MEADPLLLPLVQDLTEPPYHFLVVLLMEGTLGLLLGEFAEGFGASDLGDGVLKFKYLGLLVLQLGHPVGQLHLELPYLLLVLQLFQKRRVLANHSFIAANTKN